MILVATTAAGACQAPDAPAADRVTGLATDPTKTTKLDTPGWWLPAPGSIWQWQLTGQGIDWSYSADIYDLDLFEVDASTVSRLQTSGSRVICYLNAGSWENWRPDADTFPEKLLGSDYQGWPGERWLDIRQLELLAPIMESRLDKCQAKGFDGVEPDNIDGYLNDTGFPLSYADQLAYNRWLAVQAHRRGLSIGLKNDVEQAEDLVNLFDWALAEDCFSESWCQEISPFQEDGKAVFAAEYTDRMTARFFKSKVCPRAESLNISVILKHRDLDAWRQNCPEQGQ